MFVHFYINYFPSPGQVLVISGSSPETGNMDASRAVEMVHLGQGNWHLKLEMAIAGPFEYRYRVRENGQIIRDEWGRDHQIFLPEETDICSLYDFWQQEPDKPFLYTSAFSASLLAVPEAGHPFYYKPGQVTIKVFAPIVRRHQQLCISGDSNVFGNWDTNQVLPMEPGPYPEWQVSVNAEELPHTCHYKFILRDKADPQKVAWEWGEPRTLFTPEYMDKRLQVCSGMTFQYQDAPWKGAGVAIPVFSLRSDSSWGCGDFGDLKKMIAWAAQTGMQLIQLLPVNDTTLTGTWQDSYPYNAISIYALHPMYLSLAQLPLKGKEIPEAYESARSSLNKLPEVDYERVLALKRAYIRELFSQKGTSTMKTAGYHTFFNDNKDWLVPYAAFCYLRDKLNQPDFHNWGEYAVYQQSMINTLSQPNQPWYNDIAIHYFVQYLLHLQLKEAREEAHKQGLVLKGDIPIGINRLGVAAWAEPYLFNMDVQVGAPPDAFSLTGQNWGFPSYNWERMGADNYRWWKHRFSKMADYFDAYRIDHILGFFRLWEIPDHAVQGLLGQFRPALPFSRQELADKGFRFTDDMVTPYITDASVKAVFKDLAPVVLKKYLKPSDEPNSYSLLPSCNTQQKIQRLFSGKTAEKDRLVRDGLYQLCSEVLFVPDALQPELFHPRILGERTFHFDALPVEQQQVYKTVHDDFFYQRHIRFWKEQALEKLAPLVSATSMLVCGEDLGMVPACLPEVMGQLNILSLEIQRMPKTYGVRFENLNAIPYLSVCSTSTHDMTPIRAWWKEDPDATKQYYQQVLWKPGVTPEDCTPEIVTEIIQQHLASPAMWVIIPWQDWLGSDALLRRKNPDEERINDPSDPNHYWRYRMHLTMEQLMGSAHLNKSIRGMIQRSGR
ncbi:MAG: 4-alpha-glucanotransferase [Bacteroidota bacterium]|nr:4-alpha-glucanotransferase [Bacteroidota bacterium]